MTDPQLDLYLVRHGRTDWNAEGRFQGQSQSQLDALGRAQAEAVAPVLAALSPDVFWCSDADRTRETASYVTKVSGLEPTYDARLREYSFGALEGLLRPEVAAAYPEAFARIQASEWDGVPEIERYADVAARTTAAIADALADVPAGGTALVVSHGAAIRTATATLLGWSPEQSLSLYGMDNCGMAVLRRTSGRPWRLVAWNRTVPVPPDFTEPEPVG